MRILRLLLITILVAIGSIAKSQTTIIDSIQFEGAWRNYRLFLPSEYNSALKYPLVFNFHGYGSNAFEQEIYSDFDNVADTAGVIVCYPNGLNNSWNAFNRSPDDVGFVDTLITILHSSYNADLNRVFATGMSNGGFLCNYLGCELSDRIAAIAPVAGTTTPTIRSTCNPERHMPVLYIHGTNDATVDYNGSPLFISAADLMELWSNENNCSVSPDTVAIADIDTNDLCTAEKITWNNCDSSRQVIHYRIIGGGHTWPGSPINIGVTNKDFNASTEIWKFFNRYSLKTNTVIPSANTIKISNSLFINSFSIHLKNPDESIISIYDAEGKLMYSAEHHESEIEVEAGNLADGIYFLTIYQNTKITAFSIAKVH